MASEKFDPEKFAKVVFVITMLGVAGFAGAVYLFVL